MSDASLRRFALPLAAVAASGAALAVFAHVPAAWPLGTLALVPWLLALHRADGWRMALALAALMALGFTGAVFGWFGAAIGRFTGWGELVGVLALLCLSPVFQPQWFAYAMAYRWAAGDGWLRPALAGAAAWVACEALWPKVLGDTLGHGLHGSLWLRQVADLGGAAGLTALLLLVNAGIAAALRQRGPSARRWLGPLGVAASLLAAGAIYGALRLHGLDNMPSPDGPPLRVALIQANQTDYERRRREIGAYAVVREALDTHYALSWSALRDHGADVLLWSETVYPTTFGDPRTAVGAALDAEILGFVDAAGVPLVFGAFERDDTGEYNAAVFLEPGRGRLGSYRKSYPFPLTEYVPAWLDHPRLRAALPWTGTWQAGDGARVLPLRTRDGRQVEVVPLICLDAVRPALALDGARLGAQAILTLSNDSWFTAQPAGMRLHLTVAAFRSIETRLPQLRVTTNGHSALVDARGDVLAQTGIGQEAVLTGAIAAQTPPGTLMVRWGDWVGRAALGLLALFALQALWRRHHRRRHAAPPVRRWTVRMLGRTERWLLATLMIAAGVGLAASAWLMATRIGWQVQSIAQLQVYALGVVLPLALAGLWRYRRRAEATVTDSDLVLTQAHQRTEVPLASITDLTPWRLPLPAAGADVVLASGRRIPLATGTVGALRAALAAAGVPLRPLTGATSRAAMLAAAREAAHHRWLDHPLVKHGLFPLLPALIAFRLHQVITFGGAFGEWQIHGPGAWALGLALWWAAWSLGMALAAAGLRLAVESVVALAAAVPRLDAMALRDALEWLARLVHYVGIPAWLVFRVTAG
jgi:apolipoprotein N-acyltransferase